MNAYEKAIKQLNLQLPEPPKPAGAYRPVMVAGSLAFLSGQISKTADGTLLKGKIGENRTKEEGKEAARAAALNVISIIQNQIGWKRFDRILKIVGYVQCHPSFYDIHLVMNAASELFEQVFGEKGIHARSAVGMGSLPLNASVEIEATVKLKEA